MTYDNAGRLIETINRKFVKYRFPQLVKNTNIIPSDRTTLFICSGMQELKPKFANPDGSTYSSIQSCIRTNDLDSIGDGTHLSSFEMVGNFSFRGIPYEKSCEMWLEILQELGIKPDYVTIHPNAEDHFKIWNAISTLPIRLDEECSWSDGEIGGYCCELFKDGVEIGNLVNPLGHSTDVGFGNDRLLMFLEGKTRVDDTSVFPQVDNYVLRDHIRTLNLLFENGIEPKGTKQGYITRLLLRRCLNESKLSDFAEYKFYLWLELELLRKEKALKEAKRVFKRHSDKSEEWWKETYGILPFEISMLN